MCKPQRCIYFFLFVLNIREALQQNDHLTKKKKKEKKRKKEKKKGKKRKKNPGKNEKKIKQNQ